MQLDITILQQMFSLELVNLFTIRYLAIAIGAGLAFGLISYIFATLSGGHITPVISLAYFLTAQISPLRFLVYVTAQLIGAMVGAGFIKTVASQQFNDSQAARNLNQDGEWDGNSLAVEVITTFILIMVVLSLSEGKRRIEDKWFGHLQLGFVFLVVHLISLPIDGTSMNPTRSFASAALSGNWTAQWVFWVGPILGTFAGVAIYETLIREKHPRYEIDPNAKVVVARRSFVGPTGAPVTSPQSTRQPSATRSRKVTSSETTPLTS